MKHRNWVLAAMTDQDLSALEPDLRKVSLQAGDVQYEPEYSVEWVYFPTTAVLSVVTVMQDGRTVESDTVGFESVVGALAALSITPAVNRTFTQIAGEAIRIPAGRLRQQAEASPVLTRLLLRCVQANLAQAHQSTACNALHDVNQRLCRWLLLSHDRTDSDLVPLTQQYLATMLGVQRTTVTQAVRELRANGLIDRRRGAIHILDRARMERDVCECYVSVRTTLERLLHR